MSRIWTSEEKRKNKSKNLITLFPPPQKVYKRISLEDMGGSMVNVT